MAAVAAVAAIDSFGVSAVGNGVFVVSAVKPVLGLDCCWCCWCLCCYFSLRLINGLFESGPCQTILSFFFLHLWPPNEALFIYLVHTLKDFFWGFYFVSNF